MESFLQKALWYFPIGAMIGLWVEVFTLHDISTFHPMKGPILGGMIAMVVPWILRNHEWRGFGKRLTIGLAFGLITGAIVAFTVYQPMMVSSALEELKVTDPEKHKFVVSSTAIYSSVARHQYDGLLYCIPLGAVVGILTGLVFQIGKTRGSTRELGQRLTSLECP